MLEIHYYIKSAWKFEIRIRISNFDEISMQKKHYFLDFLTYGASSSELISTTNNRIELRFFLNEKYCVSVVEKIKF